MLIKKNFYSRGHELIAGIEPELFLGLSSPNSFQFSCCCPNKKSVIGPRFNLHKYLKKILCQLFQADLARLCSDMLICILQVFIIVDPKMLTTILTTASIQGQFRKTEVQELCYSA
jgi:hypothetical protein